MRRKESILVELRPEIYCLCRGCGDACSGTIVPFQRITAPGELCRRCARIEEMPSCCPTRTFRCFCEQNPF